MVGGAPSLFTRRFPFLIAASGCPFPGGILRAPYLKYPQFWAFYVAIMVANFDFLECVKFATRPRISGKWWPTPHLAY